jgi:hypothetical protein
MLGVLGNSSPSKPDNLNLPVPLEISIAKVLLSIKNESGISASSFKVSINILAGIATLPFYSALTGILVVKVVSKSEDETDISFVSISNKKLVNIGNGLLLLITPLIF